MKAIKNKWNLIFLILGLILFTIFFYKFGKDAITIIQSEINYFYFSLFVLFTIGSFIPYTLRFKTILNTYGEKVPFLTLLKHSICAFSISYVTPASRLGGEPLRIYMLKKEKNIRYRTGTTVVILDKFVEILGSAMYGVIGLILLIILIGVPIIFRWIFGTIVFLTLVLLFIFYNRTKKNKPTISKLFKFFKLEKIKKLKDLEDHLIEIEGMMSEFFRNHKKAFLISFLHYIINGIFYIIMFKFLLLSIGFNASITQIVLAINVWGLMNFAPSPSSLGFLEAGQSGLFFLISGNSSNGLAITLLLRGAYLFLTSIGFLMISRFGYKRLDK